MKKVLLSFLLVLFILLINPDFIFAANTYDLSDPENWNIRYDGNGEFEQIGYFEIASGDVNNDGKNDLVVTSYYRYEDSTEGTTTFVIYSTLLESLSGKGNVIDLSDDSNYNLKILPGTTGDYHEYYAASVAKINNNNLSDIVIGHGYASHGEGSLNGVAYVIYDSIIDNFTGTGNIIDLSNSAHYNIKFYGAADSHYFGYSNSTAFDLNSDGRRDLVISSDGADYNDRDNSGSTYVIYSSLLDSYAETTGNNLSMADDSNYNIRYDGPVAGNWLEAYVLTDSDTDLNGDGKDELILYNPKADYSGTDAGSFFIIDNTLIDDYEASGNEVDLADSSNYTVRYDATGGNDGSFGYSITLLSDYNDDGQTDLIVAHTRDDNNGRTDSGSVYFISGELYNEFSGTGNTVSLSNSSSFNTRIDGPVAGDNFGWDMTLTDYNEDGYRDLIVDSSSTVYILDSIHFRNNDSLGTVVDLIDSDKVIASYSTVSGFASAPYVLMDLNDDGKDDLVISDPQTDYNGTSSGSVYVIYNYPHTISADATPGYAGADNRFTIAGTVSAPDSVTDIEGVKFQVDSDDPLGDWTSCTADDGEFNSTEEEFICNTDVLSGGTHTLYVRSFDVNGSYTDRSSYESILVSVEEESPTLTATPSSTPQPSVIPSPEVEKPPLKLDSLGNLETVDGVLTYYKESGVNFTFKGTTEPFAVVEIEVHSYPLLCETEADAQGYFECTFASIPVGLHDVYITATNSEGGVTEYPKLVLGIGVGFGQTGGSVIQQVGIGFILLGMMMNSKKLETIRFKS